MHSSIFVVSIEVHLVELDAVAVVIIIEGFHLLLRRCLGDYRLSLAARRRSNFSVFKVSRVVSVINSNSIGLCFAFLTV